MDLVQEKDIIEIDYTGRLPDGTVFDTTVEQIAKEYHLHSEKSTFQPSAICVGEKQILPGLDQQLIGKQVGARVTISLSPEQAFGKRDVRNIKIVPLTTFHEHKMNPYPGLQVNMDGAMGVVIRLAGGRVMVNFNHPLAGKDVQYEVTIHRKVTDPQEQIKLFLQATLRIPQEKIVLEQQGKTATINLPMALPAPLTDILARKLEGITKIAGITIKP